MKEQTMPGRAFQEEGTTSITTSITTRTLRWEPAWSQLGTTNLMFKKEF